MKIRKSPHENGVDIFTEGYTAIITDGFADSVKRCLPMRCLPMSQRPHASPSSVYEIFRVRKKATV